MNIKLLNILVPAGAALLLGSCEIYPNGYSSFSVATNGYNTSVAWTAASYDANGFPIYGYAYGRPVYGYTVAGDPIFSINLLYAGCYVPNWGPASWCHHHHHYPHGVHHAPKPPKHHHDHKPHVRPPKNAPIHKNPSSVLGKPHHGSHSAHRPDVNKRPQVNNRPQHSVQRPSASSRPSSSRGHSSSRGRMERKR